MSDTTLILDDNLRQYIHRWGVRETPEMRALRTETRAIPGVGHMHIAPEQAQLMQWLIGALGVKKILEIGTFTGYSALAMALCLPPEGQLITCDINVEWTNIAQKYWKKSGVDSKISLQLRPALETMERLCAQEEQKGSFDFCFIDADKAAYPDYLSACLLLVRQGGVIALDNTLWSGKVADLSHQENNTRVLRDLNEKLHRDISLDLALLPIGDGLTLLRKKG